MAKDEFWKYKSLKKMSDEQWESLCDGCGKCCLLKLQSDEDEQIYSTCISCRLLDVKTCRCKDYENRQTKVPECLMLKPLTINKLKMLPDSCAYKRLSQGKQLASWHPLISGTRKTVVEANHSVSQLAVSEDFIHPKEYENFIIELL